ncbi:hypothetical protein [Halorussus marinus]|uniref:hypothetical protein n=1 Tax=Halorussus marinus TaxID=2505976 RepID=UPI00106EDB22|nr:hypothetical protein [Halorussus marinus]
MTGPTPYQTLLSCYPSRLRYAGQHRMRCIDIDNCDPITNLEQLQDDIADQITDLDTARYQYFEQARHQQQVNAVGDDHDGDGNGDQQADADGSRASSALDRFQQNGQDTQHGDDDGQPDPGQTADYDRDDIELMEITRDSELVMAPYPRSFHCVDCGHFELLDGATINSDTPPTCQCDQHGGGRMENFPYVFVCPRCARMEHPSPELHLDDDHPGRVRCPENDCNGHLHVQTADSLWDVRFHCSDCSYSRRLESNCPDCHRPATDAEPEVQSEFRPIVADATLTRPLILSNLYSSRGIRFDDMQAASRGDQADDPYHWTLDILAEPSQATVRDLFGIEEVFTVQDVDSATAVYGYEATVTSINTDLGEAGRLARTFAGHNRARRAFMTYESGRCLVFKFDEDRLLTAATGEEDPDVTYEELAEAELADLDEADSRDLIGDTTYRLVPVLHALQHALYKAAIEEAGLEDFLGAKLLVRDGAVVLVERDDVGAGGLTQLTINSDGGILLSYFHRVADMLEECTRDCDDSCPACVYLDDAQCHPFITDEVQGYTPPNSLLDRQSAAEVMFYEE